MMVLQTTALPVGYSADRLRGGDDYALAGRVSMPGYHVRDFG